MMVPESWKMGHYHAYIIAADDIASDGHFLTTIEMIAPATALPPSRPGYWSKAT